MGVKDFKIIARYIYTADLNIVHLKISTPIILNLPPVAN